MRRDHDFRKERKEVKKKLIYHYVVPIGATSWHSDHWQRYFTFWAMSHKVGCNACEHTCARMGPLIFSGSDLIQGPNFTI